MSKYTVHCYTSKSAGTAFPENTYEAETTEEVARVVHNCTRTISGIQEVQVQINEPDGREPL